MARHHTVPEVYLKGFYDYAMVAKKQHVLGDACPVNAYDQL